MIGLVVSTTALSQHLPAYELEREMPVFLDQLKKELTYPMAWGNSPVKNFKKWRRQARAASTGCYAGSTALYNRL